MRGLRGASGLALLGLAAACGEPAPAPQESRAVERRAEPAARAEPSPSAPRRAPQGEGEPNVEALFARVRDDLERGDDRDLVACLEPSARRAWLRDALLAVEVEVSVPRYEDALARRRALGLLKGRIEAHLGPVGPSARPVELSADAVADALLARVEGPDDLLAELLGAARDLGQPLDPVRAATEGRAPGPLLPERQSSSAPPGPTSAGLGRALRRVQRSSDLVEVHLEDDRGIALVRAADGGLEPVRLVRREDRVWIDES